MLHLKCHHILNILIYNGPEVFFTALEKHTLSERQNRKYSIYSLYYSDDDTIKLINQDNCLCDYISNARDYH